MTRCFLVITSVNVVFAEINGEQDGQGVSEAADLFEAFALVPDDRDWTWLASERPTSVAATRAWLDESNFDDQGQQLRRLERFRE